MNPIKHIQVARRPYGLYILELQGAGEEPDTTVFLVSFIDQQDYDGITKCLMMTDAPELPLIQFFVKSGKGRIAYSLFDEGRDAAIRHIQEHEMDIAECVDTFLRIIAELPTTMMSAPSTN